MTRSPREANPWVALEATMRSCENYRSQLFDHLFGLLESEESLELIEHAGRCEECRTALLEADGQRKLMAAAAKAEFPLVRFEAPAAVALVPADAVKLRLRPVAPSAHTGRWAAAAVLLIALGGLSVPTPAMPAITATSGRKWPATNSGSTSWPRKNAN